MKKMKNDASVRRFKLAHICIALVALYLILICFKLPHFLESAAVLSSNDAVGKAGVLVDSELLVNSVYKDSFHRILHNQDDFLMSRVEDKKSVPKAIPLQYGRIASAILKRRNKMSDFSIIEKMADEAWALGFKAWEEVDHCEGKDIVMDTVLEGKAESCPSSVSMSGAQLSRGDGIMFLPCGLAAGSSITIIGTPHKAHEEYVPQLARVKVDPTVLVSQFMVELQGLKAVVGEDPPKILHVNPRLSGDWSHQPVIEHNTCYRMQWGTAQRCDGIASKSDDDMLVDGHLRCEKWMRNDIMNSKESKIFSWFDRFIGRAKMPEVTWPFPFVEERVFVLTTRAGVEGYHVSVGGRHVTSFPYRTGFTLEDATGLAIKGDVDINSVYASSLPTSHPSFSPQRVLDFSEQWKSLPVPLHRIQLFIGVLSATNHFAERMAVRKTWMQSSAIRSSDVVVRFFVALNARKEVNAVLKKEADYFGDIVIIPFMDRYELVVLKTIAICGYGVQNVSASYVMKCDDDTFVRVDSVLKEITGVSPKRSLYMGNLNLLHRPLRSGKWAVSFQEWPEEIYPPYANGPGYVISSDIGKYIASQHVKHNLRLFKMEDVSMGMWVEQFNSSKQVQYSHSWKFCQYGCMEDYYTAHYQSPRQMLCLWSNLVRGHARCCNY